MANVLISVQDQLKRLNKLVEDIKEISGEELSILTARPDEKSWSVIEVVEHMTLGHKPYQSKIDNALSKISERQELQDQVKSRSIPSFLIKRFPPKEGRIRFKMKTMKPFKPVFDIAAVDSKKTSEIFENFNKSLLHLHDSVEQYRSKNVKEIRFNSAVGATVRFNVAEASEFIICHNERHMQQIKNILKKVK